MKKFLCETKFCDFNNILIRKKNLELTKCFNDDKNKTISLFNFVRDNIKYTFDYWNRKASETLKKGYGMCTNKTNLLVAMLRANGIPAGYGILKVNAQEYFGPLILPMMKKKVSENSIHIYTQVFLDNKWIKCDPSTDADLADKTSGISKITNLINLAEGLKSPKTNINMISFDSDYIYEDLGPFPNIDDRLMKKPKNVNLISLKINNYILEFLRLKKHKINNNFELQEKFLHWLKRKKPFFYFICKLYCS